MTPLYDVMTSAPYQNNRLWDPKRVKLAMAVGASRHYPAGSLARRHWIETGLAGGLSRTAITEVFDEVVESRESVVSKIEASLPAGFPESVWRPTRDTLIQRPLA